MAKFKLDNAQIVNVPAEQMDRVVEALGKAGIKLETPTLGMMTGTGCVDTEDGHDFVCSDRK